MSSGSRRRSVGAFGDFKPLRAAQLMPLETPLLRVSRPVAACSRCRAAKIKCDGKLPACTACEKANKAGECSSTNDQFARGKERSYVATLESKVERLERRIHEARTRRKSSLTMIDANPPPLTAAQSQSKVRRAAQRKELNDIDELVQDFGFLAVNATARDFHGFTSAMSYARLILAASTKEPLPTGLKKDMPPRHEASPLISEYLTHIQSIIPVLDESGFYASVDAVYNPDPRKAVPYDHWLVRIVLAIASAAQSQQRGDSFYSDAIGHMCAAVEHADSVLHPGSIWSIQAMLLLVLYAMIDPHHFDSWTLIGAAARASVDIGLHQDPSKTTQTPKSKLELRRRVYHCLFSLDRSTSMVQTRSFSFSDDSAHVQYPYSQKMSSPPTSPIGNKVFWAQSHEPAMALFKLRRLQSTWYTQLFQSGRTQWRNPYSYIWKAYHEMTKWFESLPQSLTPTLFEYFELELMYSYVYLLSPNPRCLEPSEHAEKLIFEHCVVYSSQMLHVTTDAATKRTPFTFYDAIRVYTTGRTFVDILTKSGDRILRANPATTPGSEINNDFNSELADPLASAPEKPPAIPIPSRHPSITSRSSVDFSTPVHRAIAAINDFLSVLSYFGRRFGYVGGISWRDRFQRESQDLFQNLQQRLLQQQQNEQGYCLWNPPNSGNINNNNNNASVSPQVPQTMPAAISRHSSATYSTSGPSMPGLNTAVYPSPPYSHNSPEYLGVQQPNNTGFDRSWSDASASMAMASMQSMPHQSMPQQSMPQQQMPAMAVTGLDTTNYGNMPQQMTAQTYHLGPLSAGDLGLGQLTAWETLPGGPLNARFG